MHGLRRWILYDIYQYYFFYSIIIKIIYLDSERENYISPTTLNYQNSCKACPNTDPMNCKTCVFIKGKLGNPDRIECSSCEGVLYEPNMNDGENKGKCDIKCNF